MSTTSFSSRFVAVALIASFAFVMFAPHLEAASKKKRTVSFEETMSVSDLKEAYAEAAAGGEKVRILIMPGHEADYGGAEFMGFYEREFVVDIAAGLEKELSSDANLEVLVARGNEGWNDDFEYYFDRQERKIKNFVEDHKEEMEELEDRGRLEDVEEQSAHNKAPEDVALRLYGINKWANDNDVALVLHLHLNDETGHASNVRGVHSGAAIYVPDQIYGNADVSRAIAEPVFARLNETTATSTFGFETKGVLESRDLIAIGAYNTAEPPSLLIEYGYIYEPRITGEGPRDLVFADFAYQTAAGVRDFFGSSVRQRYASKILPYTFSEDLLPVAAAGTTTASATSTAPVNARGIYALQAALAHLGFYPGSEASFAQCPVSGVVTPCTVDAVKAFQASKGIEQTGSLGPQTRIALNAAFGLQTPVIASVPVATATSAVPASAPSSCTFASTLELDATDAETDGEVTRLQTLLAKDASVYPEGRVTGYFGPATLAAIKRFQLKESIVTASSSAYGLVGPMTKAALASACSTAAN